MSAINDVIKERKRQIEQEGWTADHDKRHEAGDLASAAFCYAKEAVRKLDSDSATLGKAPKQWPWHDYTDISCDRDDAPVWGKPVPAWWKPSTPRRDLIKAAALIIAEIDRMDRSGGDE